jgi:hypothetical protein
VLPVSLSGGPLKKERTRRKKELEGKKNSKEKRTRRKKELEGKKNSKEKRTRRKKVIFHIELFCFVHPYDFSG